MLEEEIENNNTFKISVPLFTEQKLTTIDNNFESFVNKITECVIKEKDLAIAQYIIKKQKYRIDQLETNNQKLIEKLEKDIKELDDNGYFEYLEERDLEKTIKILQEILEILKGEK